MIRTTLTAALVAAALTGPVLAEPRTYEIDPTHASIGFLVDHIGYAKVLGQFLKTEGSFVFDEETLELSDVNVTIDASSVFTNHDARDNHVRSNDFLAAGDNPDITFTASGGQIETDRTGTVTGDLTIRGVTKPVTLDVVWNKTAPYPFGHKKQTIGVSARGSILRSDYDMTYAQGGIVGDQVDLIIEVEAIVAE